MPSAPLLHLHLFGPFSASLDDGSPVSFPTDKVRALVAFLALETDRAHDRHSLAALLWPEWPDDVALNNVRKTLHRLREAVAKADPALAERLLAADRRTVAMRPDALDLDASAFEADLAAVAAHSHVSLAACPSCLERLSMAVNAYRADLLDGFALPDAPAFDEWLALRREALHQRQMGALLRLAEAYLVRGEPMAAAELAQRCLAFDPWSDAACRQAVQALSLAGLRSEALALFDRFEQLLADELGILPEPDTLALVERVRAGADLAPAAPRRVELHHFPPTYSPFTGREAELVQLSELLAEPGTRLVSLVGPGGVGKSRLAVEAMRRHTGEPADAYFVALADVTDAAHVPEAVAVSLDLTFRERADPRSQLLDHLAGRACWLVLDNFEQLSDATGLLAEILDAAPEVRLLVTSRHALHLRAERLVRLEGLACPDEAGTVTADLETPAVRMFLHAAEHFEPGRSHQPDEVADVSRLCRLVEGLPLAIEIAAAMRRSQSCAAIADAIGANLNRLASPFHDSPERQRSMLAVLDYSWALLSPVERLAWVGAAVFHSPFTPDAAVDIIGTSSAVLTALVDKSLLRQAAGGRLTLHALSRRFAGDQRSQLGGQSGWAKDLDRRHATWFLGQLAAAEPDLFGSTPHLAVRQLLPDMDDLRAAWSWATEPSSPDLLSTSLASLRRLLSLAGLFQAGAELFATAAERCVASLPMSPAAGDPTVGIAGRLLTATAYFLSRTGDGEGARNAAERAVELCDLAGSPGEAALARGELASLLLLAGEPDACRALLDAALSLAALDPSSRAQPEILSQLGECCLRTGQPQAAVDYQRAALALREAAGDRVGIARAHGALAVSLGNSGDLDAALSENLAALADFQAMGLSGPSAVFLGNRGYMLSVLGRDDEALEFGQQALALDEAQGHRLGMARHLSNMARVYRRQERWAEALTALDRALELLAAQGAMSFHDSLLTDRAEALLGLGRLAEARATNDLGLARMRAAGVPDHIADGEALAERIAAAYAASPEIVAGEPAEPV
jgi:DNA-binding SARP family transcriptional activator/predicted ATPase